ncbi:DUF397 domain-containing protein [Yinghuangia sp. YIM S10712]|uniref:DUF397 domain-containing protein n=1 Tax=Yinghuangia sp. YIM S10712 TaxID=3436930 RepID=UPI003F531825
MSTERLTTRAVNLDWRKSSYSGGNGGECVEVAPAPAAVFIRDSKNPSGTRLNVTTSVWSTFVQQTK